MIKRHKDLLRTIVGELRRTLAGVVGAGGEVLRGDLDRELERIGIAADGTVTPLDALHNPTPAERRAHSVAVAQLVSLPQQERAAARIEIVERAAYSWINRLLALRAMEARGLIDETLRNNPDYDGLSEALFVLRQTDPSRAAGADAGWWAVLDDAFTAQARSLPGLFATDDPNTALRPSTPGLLRCIALVGGAPQGYTLDEANAAFADPDAIGWAYQFYQEGAKAAVYAKLGAGGKVATRAEIAAATQLFTEPYMVKWLLQNSLGRSYHEMFPDTALTGGWEYYITPEKLEPPAYMGLASLTVMDPCMGSGHFLREAFDMLAAMYRERHPELSATEIADRVLRTHLHGIDIDPRAAQLAALTLYLRAWDGVRDEHRGRRKPGTALYAPPTMNLATTPTGLNAGSLERHLRRHPQDRVLKPLLEGIFTALERADILGSLLRPGEHLDTAITALQNPHTIEMDFDADDAALRRTIRELARHDPAELRRMLLDRVAESFAAEAGNTDDVAVALFGQEAEQGVRLLQLLDRKYAVVGTNPPYMGINNMGSSLKSYLEKSYSISKRDLYSTFMIRSLEFSQARGRVAMVTMQSWAFLAAFAAFREHLQSTYRLECFAHLGSNAFDKELKLHVGVAVACFTIRNAEPTEGSRMVALRGLGPVEPIEKAVAISKAARDTHSHNRYHRQQFDFRVLPQQVLAYWLPDTLFAVFEHNRQLRSICSTGWGAATSDNNRFLRLYWEVGSNRERWKWHRKGGGYTKWCGHNEWCLDWGSMGARLIASLLERYPYLGSNYEIKVRPATFHRTGWCYTKFAAGSLAFRRVELDDTTNAASPAIFDDGAPIGLGAILNSRVMTYLVRAVCNKMDVEPGYIEQIPLPQGPAAALNEPVTACLSLKHSLTRLDITSPDFTQVGYRALESAQRRFEAELHTIEGFLDRAVFDLYGMEDAERRVVLQDTGHPVGMYSMLAEYGMIPIKPPGKLSLLSDQGIDYFARVEKRVISSGGLDRLRSTLRILYQAGPGAREVGSEDIPASSQAEDDSESSLDAYIPVPTETFLEELSQKLQIHPISVYWLLEELRAEGVRCKPEEQRLLEDHLTVLVLRLLGHRWPKEVQSREPLPGWADRDGIIPLTPGLGAEEQPLADRLRARLREEDGEVRAQETAALLLELTGVDLEEWLRRRFFTRHVRQFKYRPVAWHLASTPAVGGGGKKKGGGRRAPAFECFLYYHACASDVLARIRTRYVEPLLRAERRRAEDTNREGDDTSAAVATARIHELEEFGRALRQVEEEGFASPELDKLHATEPLDRWSGDGYLAPVSRDELLHNERSWRVDINDGVRVNIAPIQLAGVLAGDVLKVADAKKAITDRARWRSDERRWVREGKLPRCGWMADDVPESPAWTALAPQREAERIKLEQKRKAVIEKLESAGE